MKNTKTAYTILTGCLLSLAGCIQEFIPQNIREESGLLIVDGTITNGESVFVLSRSVGLSGELGEEAMINHAEVAVESNDGARIPARCEGKGRYVAPTGELEARLQYRLSVEIDGETYQSEYLSPIFSAGIDSIFPMKEEQHAPVCIYLSSHAAENSSKYYRWKYREAWEVRAELYATARWNDRESEEGEERERVIFHSLYTSENTYYCWGRDSSKVLIIGDTEKARKSLHPSPTHRGLSA